MPNSQGQVRPCVGQTTARLRRASRVRIRSFGAVAQGHRIARQSLGVARRGPPFWRPSSSCAASLGSWHCGGHDGGRAKAILAPSSSRHSRGRGAFALLVRAPLLNPHAAFARGGGRGGGRWEEGAGGACSRFRAASSSRHSPFSVSRRGTDALVARLPRPACVMLAVIGVAYMVAVAAAAAAFWRTAIACAMVGFSLLGLGSPSARMVGLRVALLPVLPRGVQRDKQGDRRHRARSTRSRAPRSHGSPAPWGGCLGGGTAKDATPPAVWRPRKKPPWREGWGRGAELRDYARFGREHTPYPSTPPSPFLPPTLTRPRPRDPTPRAPPPCVCLPPRLTRLTAEVCAHTHTLPFGVAFPASLVADVLRRRGKDLLGGCCWSSSLRWEPASRDLRASSATLRSSGAASRGSGGLPHRVRGRFAQQ